MDGSKNTIIENLQSYNVKIQNCIGNAVTHFQEKLADESAIISQSTKANYIRDFIVENAKKVFYDDPNVTIHRKRGMIVFLFHTTPHIFLKFKKFNKYNRVSYSRTMQSFAFSTQEELFTEYNNSVNLHAGYKWNDTGTQIECLIGYPNGEGKHAWIIYLADNISQPLIQNIPTVQTKPQIKLKIKPIENANEKIG